MSFAAGCAGFACHMLHILLFCTSSSQRCLLVELANWSASLCCPPGITCLTTHHLHVFINRLGGCLPAASPAWPSGGALLLGREWPPASASPYPLTVTWLTTGSPARFRRPGRLRQALFHLWRYCERGGGGLATGWAPSIMQSRSTPSRLGITAGRPTSASPLLSQCLLLRLRAAT